MQVTTWFLLATLPYYASLSLSLTLYTFKIWMKRSKIGEMSDKETILNDLDNIEEVRNFSKFQKIFYRKVLSLVCEHRNFELFWWRIEDVRAFRRLRRRLSPFLTLPLFSQCYLSQFLLFQSIFFIQDLRIWLVSSFQTHSQSTSHETDDDSNAGESGYDRGYAEQKREYGGSDWGIEESCRWVQDVVKKCRELFSFLSTYTASRARV